MPAERLIDRTTLGQFLEALAEGSAAPGGGSASALAGSMGAALVEMVVKLTVGKKGFASQEAALRKIGEEARAHREALVETMEKDISAYQRVMEAYLLPRGTEEERALRKEAVQQALKKASDPPLFTAVTCLKVLHLCRQAAESGNPNALCDAAVGALLAEAALKGGVLNALVNFSALRETKQIEKMKKDLHRLEEEGAEIKRQILERVRWRVPGE